MQSYATTIQYLFELLPMYQRVGSVAMKKDLRNIIRLCHALGHPHRRFRSIHVAGTNGKGSVSHMLASILQSSDLKVGLYTSPHYRDFRERIKINGIYISEHEVVDFVGRLKGHIHRIRPSFFEVTVAMAFDHFCRHAVDIAVVETGLGGRLDSTNILEPMLSVITNISFDHQDFLGDTLSAIAREKAGIIKSGVPALVGVRHPETDQVFLDKASAQNAQMWFSDEWCEIEDVVQTDLSQFKVNYKSSTGNRHAQRIDLDLLGAYQVENAQTTLAAVEILRTRDLKLSDAVVRNGLAQVRKLTNFMGRWQQLQIDPRVIVDSAHNKAGLQVAMQGLAALDFDHLHIVLGMVKNKDHDSILALLPTDATYYFCAADQPRSLDPSRLRDLASKHDLHGEWYKSVNRALSEAISRASAEDLIFVGGSTFVTAEVL